MAEDRNWMAIAWLVVSAMPWRPPFAVAEDRNTGGVVGNLNNTYCWRPPFAVIEDRRPTGAGAVAVATPGLSGLLAERGDLDERRARATTPQAGTLPGATAEIRPEEALTSCPKTAVYETVPAEAW